MQEQTHWVKAGMTEREAHRYRERCRENLRLPTYWPDSSKHKTLLGYCPQDIKANKQDQ